MRQILTAALVVVTLGLRAQELFIQSEPASNMPARTWGLRLGSDTWDNGERLVSRIGFEGMYGITKDLMFHIQGFGSNQFNGFEAETGGIYAKYRLYTDDDYKYHFRVAVFGEALFGKQNSHSPSFSSKGSGPMVGGGAIATLLENRFAMSLTAGAGKATKDIALSEHHQYSDIIGTSASLSAGYLILPRQYEGYSDLNFNFYTEVLSYHSWYTRTDRFGSAKLSDDEIILSFGPQLIINSLTRLDLAYTLPLYSGFEEKKANSLFLRVEHNFF